MNLDKILASQFDFVCEGNLGEPISSKSFSISFIQIYLYKWWIVFFLTWNWGDMYSGAINFLFSRPLTGSIMVFSSFWASISTFENRFDDKRVCILTGHCRTGNRSNIKAIPTVHLERKFESNEKYLFYLWKIFIE